MGLVWLGDAYRNDSTQCFLNTDDEDSVGVKFNANATTTGFPQHAEALHGVCREEVLAVAAECNSDDPGRQLISTPLPTCAQVRTEFPIGDDEEALEDPRLQSDNQNSWSGRSSHWQVVAARPFDGNFEGKGSNVKSKRQKPPLIEFKAKQYEQKPECKALTYDNFEELPRENPCHYVSSSKPKNEEEAIQFQEEGKAGWWGDDGAQAGYTYENIFGCFSREASRGVDLLKLKFLALLLGYVNFLGHALIPLSCRDLLATSSGRPSIACPYPFLFPVIQLETP